MIRRLATNTLLLGMGGLVVGALYWLFLNTPESSGLMLTASAVLIFAIIGISGATLNAVILIALGNGLRSSLRRGVRSLLWFLLAAVVMVAGWWLVLRADAWIATHSGEINAWFIAQFDWSDLSVLFRAATWISIWVRWVVLPVIAIAALASLLNDGGRAVRSPRWLVRAFNWRILTLTTVVFLVLVLLPWQASSWMPEGLPPNWIEPTLAAVRLVLMAAVMTIGWAVIIDRTARTATTRSSP